MDARCAAAVLLLLAAGLSGCGAGPPACDRESLPGPGCPPWFSDEAAARGIHHVTAEGLDLPSVARMGRLNLTTDLLGGYGSETKPLAEMQTMGGGIAVGDLDADGDFDLFFPDFGPDWLYRNRGDGTFEDISSWLGDAGLGDGRAGLWFDYDNDGFPDLFVCNLKDPSRLLHNEGGQALRDVTQAARVGAASSCQGAVASDADGDGRLDFLVVNYFPWWVGNYPADALSHDDAEFLYHNNGDGTFADAAKASGLLDPGDGPTLGAGFADYDLDGDQDLLLANDFANPASLWQNDGRGHFARVNGAAHVKSEREGMGVIWADFNGDGRLDAYISNIYHSLLGPDRRRGNVLLTNNGDGTFRDTSAQSGAYNALWSWGGAVLDADSDGDLDLFVPNGFDSAIGDSQAQDMSQLQPLLPPPDYGQQGTIQPNRFFENRGDATFRMRAVAWGLDARVNGRGAAAVDVDGDGDVDLVTTAVSHPPMLYVNAAPQGGSVEIRLQGTASNRDAVGAVVWVTAGGRILAQQREAGSGYESQSWPVLHFGLGAEPEAQHLRVLWPDGTTQDAGPVGPGHYLWRQGLPLAPA